tara:strand:- start:1447 stop:1614 length:168 start_codon:yes stop_codon:yes gene_type:complete
MKEFEMCCSVGCDKQKVESEFNELEVEIKDLKLENAKLELENAKLKRELQGWLEE